MSEQYTVKIKPILDFADDKGRLFIAGKYYFVTTDKAIDFAKEGKAFVKKIWHEGDGKCLTYTKNTTHLQGGE